MPEEHPLKTLTALKAIFETKASLLSNSFRRYSNSAEVSITANGGVFVLSTRIGILPILHGIIRESQLNIRQENSPLGLRLRNQSFFCSLVPISRRVWVTGSGLVLLSC